MWLAETEWKIVLGLYVQYDAHLQQVVDRKKQAECNMVKREGRIVKDTSLPNRKESIKYSCKK